MKPTILALALLYSAACGVPGSPRSSAAQDTISADPLRWMVGTWNCTAGYHNTPPFKAHQALATYTVTEDDGGVVHGQYKELSGDAELISFEDEWSIGSTIVDSLGNVAADLKAATSDGSLMSGAGTDRGASASGAVLGVASFEGLITLPDGGVQNWHYSAIDLPASSSTPAVHFTANLSIGTPTVKQVYLGLACARDLTGSEPSRP